MLKKNKISLEQSGQFSRLFIDYIKGSKKLEEFYSYSPNIDSFAAAIELKKKQGTNRNVLTETLHSQYEHLPAKKAVKSNISSLSDDNTFTVCTGHQLCLFTGPLYFVYKIISTINLAESLQKRYPDSKFVPVYWMATEDHDFEEISTVSIFGKNVIWKNEEKGAVGRMSTASLNVVLDELRIVLGNSPNAEELMQLFTDAYLKNANMTSATRYLVHELFGEYGLVALDADDKKLKQEFVKEFKDDIQNNTNHRIISETIKKMNELGYDAQVNPRAINVFKLTDKDRVRIEKADPEVMNLEAEFYSPNVVLRPLYQQKILPNLAYVGGPGEFAYWLEYKAMFDHHQIMFPVLIPRNFVMLTDDKTEQQISKLGFTTLDVFTDTEVLIKHYVSRNAGADISLKEEEERLKSLYEGIIVKATAADPTLKASAEGELQKALNALKSIEAKLMRSEKQKQESGINQIKKIKDRFFPEGVLQERHDNLSQYYLNLGKQLIPDLKNELDPFEFEMLILKI